MEELLRNEPPVHMRERIPHADIDVAGTKIPQHASVILVLASGDRGPMRFHEPDRFDPTRPGTNTSASAAVSTSATAGPWPGSRHTSRSARCFPTSAAPAWSRTRLYRQNAMLRGPCRLSIQL